MKRRAGMVWFGFFFKSWGGLGFGFFGGAGIYLQSTLKPRISPVFKAVDRQTVLNAGQVPDRKRQRF